MGTAVCEFKIDCTSIPKSSVQSEDPHLLVVQYLALRCLSSIPYRHLFSRRHSSSSLLRVLRPVVLSDAFSAPYIWWHSYRTSFLAHQRKELRTDIYFEGFFEHCVRPTTKTIRLEIAGGARSETLAYSYQRARLKITTAGSLPSIVSQLSNAIAT